MGWHHSEVPEIAVISSEITTETGEFRITARVNSRDLLVAEDLSLQVSSRVTTGPDGKCEESTDFSHVEVARGTLAEELKEIKHYHQNAIEWNQLPEVKDYRIMLSGRAQPGRLSFDWREGFCGQLLLYELDPEGYHYIASVRALLPEGYTWDDPSKAEITKGHTNADGSCEVVIEIWDKGLLSRDHVVLVVRAESVSDKAANRCSQSDTLSAVTVKPNE